MWHRQDDGPSVWCLSLGSNPSFFLTRCATSGKSLNLSVPHVLIYITGTTELLGGLTEHSSAQRIISWCQISHSSARTEPCPRSPQATAPAPMRHSPCPPGHPSVLTSCKAGTRSMPWVKVLIRVQGAGTGELGVSPRAAPVSPQP